MSGQLKRTFEPNACNESKRFRKRSRMRGTIEDPRAGERTNNTDQGTELLPTSDSAIEPPSRMLPTRGFVPSQRSATAGNSIRRLPPPPPPPPQRARTRFTGHDSHARTGPFPGHPHRSVGTPYQNGGYPCSLSDTGGGGEAKWLTHSESVKEEPACFMDDAVDIPVAPHLNSVSSSCSRLWEELCTTMHLRDSMAGQIKNEIKSSLTHLESQRELITRERTQLEKMRGELEAMRSGIAKTREVAQEEANRVKLEKEALYAISTEVSVQVAELKGLKRQLEEEWSKMDGSKLKMEPHKSVENRHLNELIDQDRCTTISAKFGQQKLIADNPDPIVFEKPNYLDPSASLNKLGDSEPQRGSFGCAKAYKRKIEDGAHSASMMNYVPSAVTRVQGGSNIVDSDTLKQNEAENAPVNIETTADTSLPKQSEGENTPASILNSTMREESLSTGMEYPGNLCVFSDAKLQFESPCSKAYKQKKEEGVRGVSSASMMNSVLCSTATEESLSADIEYPGNLCIFSDVKLRSEPFPCAKTFEQKKEEGAVGASSASMMNYVPSAATTVQGSSNIVDLDTLKQSEAEDTPVIIETAVDTSILKQSEGEYIPASIMNSTAGEETLFSGMGYRGNLCVFSDAKSQSESFPCANAYKPKKEEGARGASSTRMINSVLNSISTEVSLSADTKYSEYLCVCSDAKPQSETFPCSETCKQKKEEGDMGASSASMMNSVPTSATRVRGSLSIVDCDTLKHSEAENAPMSIETTADTSIRKQSEGENTPASILNSTMREESLSTGMEYPGNLCVFSEVKLQNESFPCSKAYTRKKEEGTRGASSASMINSVLNSTATEILLSADMEYPGYLCVFSDVKPQSESLPCTKTCEQKKEEGAMGASSKSTIDYVPSSVTRVQGSSSIVDSDTLKQSEADNIPLSIDTTTDTGLLKQSEVEHTPANILNSTAREESLSTGTKYLGNLCVFSDFKPQSESFPCANAYKRKKEVGASSASMINSVLNSTATEESLSASTEYPGNLCVFSDVEPQSESFPCAKTCKQKKEEGAMGSSSASMIDSVSSTVTRVEGSSSIVDSDTLKQSEAENIHVSIETPADASIPKQSEEENTPAVFLNSTAREEPLSTGTKYPWNLSVSSDVKLKSESFPSSKAYKRKKEEGVRRASSASVINSVLKSATEQSLSTSTEYPGNSCVFSDVKPQSESFPCAKACKQNKEEGAMGASSASMIDYVVSAVTSVHGSSSIVDSHTFNQSEVENTYASIQTTADGNILKQSEGENTPANSKAYMRKKEETPRGASSGSIINSVLKYSTTEESQSASMEYPGSLCAFSDVKPHSESFPCAEACEQYKVEAAMGASSASIIDYVPSAVTRVQGCSSIVDSDTLKQSEAENTHVSIETTANASILKQSEVENTPAIFLNSTVREEPVSTGTEYPGNLSVFSDVKPQNEFFPSAKACKRKKEEGAWGASSASMINSVLNSTATEQSLSASTEYAGDFCVFSDFQLQSASLPCAKTCKKKKEQGAMGASSACIIDYVPSVVTRIQGSSSIVDSGTLKQSEADNTPLGIESTVDASILKQSEGENTPASILNSTVTKESFSSGMEYPGNLCVSSDAKPQSESFPCVEAYKRKKEVGARGVSSESMIDSVLSTATGVMRSSSIVDSDALNQSEAENMPVSIEITADTSILKQSKGENTPTNILNSIVTEESLSTSMEYPVNLCVLSDIKIDKLNEMVLSQHLEIKRKDPLLDGYDLEHGNIVDSDTCLIVSNSKEGLAQKNDLVEGHGYWLKRPDSAKQAKRDRIPIEVALQEDAPGLYEMLNERRLLDDSEVYGDFSEEFCSDTELHLESFKDLDINLGKFWKQPPLDRECLAFGNGKTSYCISCLASLIEQANLMKQRDCFVAWGWCRELRSFIFIFDDHNRIVLERPENGYATYFFAMLENVPIKWQVIHLIRVMNIAYDSQGTLIEDRPLEVEKHLIENEAKILKEYGCSFNAGLGSLLHFCDHIIHDTENDSIISYWKQKIEKCLMDGYDHGRTALQHLGLHGNGFENEVRRAGDVDESNVSYSI